VVWRRPGSTWRRLAQPRRTRRGALRNETMTLRKLNAYTSPYVHRFRKAGRETGRRVIDTALSSTMTLIHLEGDVVASFFLGFVFVFFLFLFTAKIGTRRFHRRLGEGVGLRATRVPFPVSFPRREIVAALPWQDKLRQSNLLIEGDARCRERYLERRPEMGDPRQRIAFERAAHRGSPLDGQFTEAPYRHHPGWTGDYRQIAGDGLPLSWERITHALSAGRKRTASRCWLAKGVASIIQRTTASPSHAGHSRKPYSRTTGTQGKTLRTGYRKHSRRTQSSRGTVASSTTRPTAARRYRRYGAGSKNGPPERFGGAIAGRECACRSRAIKVGGHDEEDFLP